MLNHWDNSDGSIERGYSGNSFFFNNGEIINLERDSVSLVASEEMKANDILVMLFNNSVSPIHLVDIVGEYSDLCAAEF